MKRGLGYIKDTPDPRDQHFARLGAPVAVPVSASLKDKVVEVLDHGSSSSCVAHSFAQALRIADKIAGVVSPQLSSREFLYYNARAYDGGALVDQGTQLRSCARGLAKFGRPPESAWPFNMAHIDDRPSWEAYREGYDHKGPSAYLRVTTLSEIRQAIAAGKPVVGGTDIGQSFEDFSGGAVYNPDPHEPKLGGHALTVVAYDATSFTICNSWSDAWCEGGFIRVSPAFMATFTDIWSIHL